MKHKKIKMTLLIVLAALGALAVAGCIVLRRPVFGGTPGGERLARIMRSPNWHDGQFHNRLPTPVMTDSGGGFLAGMYEFLFASRPVVTPPAPLTMARRDLRHLPADRDLYVWFGHSSYLLSLHGTSVLVDPTFCAAAPFSFANRAFAGTDRYRPADMPAVIDYLVITHDHYDHLDYETVRQLRPRVRRVICPLGVGAHFERWGYRPGLITELDWDETATGPDGTRFHCLTARHFSGRTLRRNTTLWASFLVETGGVRIFLGGDSGYGPHFQQIGTRFGRIDLAILENGQYDSRWAHIHTLPHQLGREAVELRARQVVTVHHSKYALARHPWDEPLRNELRARDAYDLHLIVARLGDITPLSLR